MLKSKQPRWQSIPYWVIIVLCTIAGVLFALFASWRSIVPAQPVLIQLPPLPVDAVAIHSIDIRRFFRAAPRIQAADGQVYGWSSGGEWIPKPTPLAEIAGDPCPSASQENDILIDCQSAVPEEVDYIWETDSSPLAELIGDPCTPKNVAFIKASAAPVIDCQVVRTTGEWCPGTLVSIAVTERGDVWELTEDQPCLFFFGVNVLFLGFAGFVLGVILAGLRKIVLLVLKRLPAAGNG